MYKDKKRSRPQPGESLGGQRLCILCYVGNHTFLIKSQLFRRLMSHVNNIAGIAKIASGIQQIIRITVRIILRVFIGFPSLIGCFLNMRLLPQMNKTLGSHCFDNRKNISTCRRRMRAPHHYDKSGDCWSDFL